MFKALGGLWTVTLGTGETYPVTLPGTLDTNLIGEKDCVASAWHPDVVLDQQVDEAKGQRIKTRFTRKVRYEGAVSFKKCIGDLPTTGKRVFLEIERARCLKVAVAGKFVAPFDPPSLSTPQVFELTGQIGRASCRERVYVLV